MANVFDLIVIGAGPGGYVAALRAAKLGLKVAIVEDREAGGTCLNRGCVPAKALINASEKYRELRDIDKYGIHVSDVDINLEKLDGYKNDVVAKLRNGVESLLEKNKNITVIKGRGCLCRDKQVQVGDELFSANAIIIATGSKPAVPSIQGVFRFNFDEAGKKISPAQNGQIPQGLNVALAGQSLELNKNIYTSDLLFESIPRKLNSLAIIGGGVIGVEFASVYEALGTKVTIIEALPALLPMMDKEISQNLKMIFKKRGIDVLTTVSVTEIEHTHEGVKILLQDKDGNEINAVEADAVLIATGRKPNTDGLFAEGVSESTFKEVTVINDERKNDSDKTAVKEQKCNNTMFVAGQQNINSEDSNVKKQGCNGTETNNKIKLDRGRILVDGNFATDMEGVYAIGDVIGGLQLAHVASAQAVNVVNYIVRQKGDLSGINLDDIVDYDLNTIPSCVYTNPEIACVGFTEAELKSKNISYKVRKAVMGANAKSVITDEERGFIKLIFDENDILIGAQLMCARATDIIGELANAVVNKADLKSIARVVRAHPTYYEAIGEALM